MAITEKQMERLLAQARSDWEKDRAAETNPNNSAAAVEHMVNELRSRGVSKFKGKLLAADGVTPLWELDIEFERQPPRRRSDEEGPFAQ